MQTGPAARHSKPKWAWLFKKLLRILTEMSGDRIFDAEPLCIGDK
jgi:hypothetical protein